MRTHYLETRSRIKSVTIDLDKATVLRFYVPYMINGDQYDDIYEITAALVDEDQQPVKVKYERRN